MTDVEHAVLSTPRHTLRRRDLRWQLSLVAVGAVLLSTVVVSPRPASASNLSNARTKAHVLLNQINRINGEVGRLGQKYDEAQINLTKFNNEIKNTKATVAAIKGKVARSKSQLRKDVVYSYITNGTGQGNNPIFSSDAAKTGAKNVYTEIAEGNINATISGLKNYRIELIHERGLLKSEDYHARTLTRDAAKSFNTSKVLQAHLKNTLSQVKGQIATFVDQAEAASQASSAAALNDASNYDGITPPPPDSKADIAIRAAESYLGVPYVWGGASRYGVDCSGLVMLAYDAAGIYLSHYSGAQWDETERVPLVDIEPGDLLFYGYDGDEHVAMYIGHGLMIEAPETGEVVHITPVRLGYGFAGLGRPRG